MRGPFTACLVAASALIARCAPTDVHRALPPRGVAFDVGGHATAYSASGLPRRDARGSILGAGFAIARPDSFGGVTVLAFQPTGTEVGDLFVLQAPLRPGTYACTDAATECVGSYLVGVRNMETVSRARQFRVTAGSLTVQRTHRNRLAATFRLMLRATDGSGTTIRLENGTVQVPYSAHACTDAPLACVLSLTSLFPGRCRA